MFYKHHIFLLLVTLVHLVNHEKEAEGTRVARQMVHGEPLGANEVAVTVSAMNCDEFTHPKYNYAVEVKGFTAWLKD